MVKHTQTICRQRLFKLFHGTIPFLYLLKTLENSGLLTFSKSVEVEHWREIDNYQYCLFFPHKVEKGNDAEISFKRIEKENKVGLFRLLFLVAFETKYSRID